MEGVIEISSSKALITAGWDSVPHLDERTKAELLASTPPHLRDARSKGTPSLGSGAIYPVPLSEVLIDPFMIPDYWPRAYALDVGWNRTACLWGAWNPADWSMVLYSEHYRGQAEASIHAAAIMARGKWIKGVIDPASRGRSQRDGEQLLADYQNLGLHLSMANNSVHAGIDAVWMALSTGRLKVFRTLVSWIDEYRIYRRDEKGAIVKKNDHLMDCFHGDTLVETSEGFRRIAEIEGQSGYVRTVGGQMAPFTECRRYGRDKKIVRLAFAGHGDILCTPDHLFLTPDGWVKAADMEGKSCHTAVSSSMGDLECQSQSYRTRSKSIGAADTISAGDTSRGMGSASIGASGPTRTARSLMDFTSTMSITTEATTHSKISRFFRTEIMSPIIRSAISAAFPMRRSARRALGMALTLVRRGIESIMRTSSTSSIGTPGFAASSAVAWQWSETPGPIAFAPMPARPARVTLPASMMSIERASSAGLSSASTNTGRQSHAADPALPRCLSVTEAGRADVYCLTVPGIGAFAVGGGLIVHNCTRYLVMTGRAVAQPVPATERQAQPSGFVTLDDSAGY